MGQQSTGTAFIANSRSCTSDHDRAPAGGKKLAASMAAAAPQQGNLVLAEDLARVDPHRAKLPGLQLV